MGWGSGVRLQSISHSTNNLVCGLTGAVPVPRNRRVRNSRSLSCIVNSKPVWIIRACLRRQFRKQPPWAEGTVTENYFTRMSHEQSSKAWTGNLQRYFQWPRRQGRQQQRAGFHTGKHHHQRGGKWYQENSATHCTNWNMVKNLNLLQRKIHTKCSYLQKDPTRGKTKECARKTILISNS